MRSSNQTIPKSTAVLSALAAKELLKLSGSALLNRILDEESPEVFFRRLSEEDFFWIVKRIGEADCLPLLRLASKDQWEYLLDLETWEKDRLNADRVLSWLSRLSDADPARFAAWLFSQGDALFSLLINRKTEVVIRDGEEEADLSGGYFTLDGRFYIRPIREEDREAVEGLLRTLASKDYHAYQALLYGLAALIPAEVEEELYRFRNGRLAEHGFLPYEEAVAVYAPLDPTVLRARSRRSFFLDGSAPPRKARLSLSLRSFMSERTSCLPTRFRMSAIPFSKTASAWNSPACATGSSLQALLPRLPMLTIWQPPTAGWRPI